MRPECKNKRKAEIHGWDTKFELGVYQWVWGREMKVGALEFRLSGLSSKNKSGTSTDWQPRRLCREHCPPADALRGQEAAAEKEVPAASPSCTQHAPTSSTHAGQCPLNAVISAKFVPHDAECISIQSYLES